MNFQYGNYRICALRDIPIRPRSKWNELVTVLIEAQRDGAGVLVEASAGDHFNASSIQQHVVVRTRKTECMRLHVGRVTDTPLSYFLWLEPMYSAATKPPAEEGPKS